MLPLIKGYYVGKGIIVLTELGCGLVKKGIHEGIQVINKQKIKHVCGECEVVDR